jgi:hypothetical protein
MPNETKSMTNTGQAGRRVPQFCQEVGLSRSSVYNLMIAGKIKAVKAGKCIIIVTKPDEYLATLPSAF